MRFCCVDFQTTTTTQALFDQVIKYLGLTEKFFFGLTQLQGRNTFQNSYRKTQYKQQNCRVLADYWMKNQQQRYIGQGAKLAELTGMKMDF